MHLNTQVSNTKSNGAYVCAYINLTICDNYVILRLLSRLPLTVLLVYVQAQALFKQVDPTIPQHQYFKILLCINLHN